MKHLHSIIFLALTLFGSMEGTIVRRAAIDVGSGGTKLAIADVNKESNQISQLVLDTSFAVPYQASLDKSSDGTFDTETKEKGLAAFQDIQEIIQHYEVEEVAAVATSAFRKSNNSREFVQEVEKHTGIAIQIISQREEGEIAFFSAVASGEFDPDEVVVWDIGTGSLQMTTKNDSEGLTVYMGEQMGSVAFKSYIIDTIQEKDLEDILTPNPISEEELKLADAYARAFGRKAYPLIKQKIQNNGMIIGIGRLFYHSIRPLASEDGVITRSGLRHFILDSLNKTDQELDNPFAHVDVSNCILTLAIMKALHIQEIRPIDTTSAKGLLVAPYHWD